jgi:UDP-N-acetylglucosamine/UDP-N-acetylgalactosamine diphosphorylase
MEILNQLQRRGVRISPAAGIEIGPEVHLDQISEGVVIGAACRIYGERTLILPGARLGSEGPVTVENCQIGPGVELKGGYFRGAVFLSGAQCGSGAHVRDGTILEEYASFAHTVGLKQTILFPFVTLGSLINFCDCLMAGGTDRKNHSEVGSSYIHFNFTPNQHKATPSLIGDVPRGVMLNQRPIFLGGQGGMVGPLRLNYGTTVAAGTILRKDELRPNRLIFGGVLKGGNIDFRPGRYTGISRIIKNNLIYIGNLLALRHWYYEIRALFVAAEFPRKLLDGLLHTVDAAIRERMQRLKELAIKMEEGGDPTLATAWTILEEKLIRQRERLGDLRLLDAFKDSVVSAISREGKDYIRAVQSLNTDTAEQGAAWLQGIIDEAVASAFEAME